MLPGGRSLRLKGDVLASAPVTGHAVVPFIKMGQTVYMRTGLGGGGIQDSRVVNVTGIRLDISP